MRLEWLGQAKVERSEMAEEMDGWKPTVEVLAAILDPLLFV